MARFGMFAGTSYRCSCSARTRFASCRFFAACIRFRWTCFVSSCCWYMSLRGSSGGRGRPFEILGMVSSLSSACLIHLRPLVRFPRLSYRRVVEAAAGPSQSCTLAMSAPWASATRGGAFKVCCCPGTPCVPLGRGSPSSPAPSVSGRNNHRRDCDRPRP